MSVMSETIDGAALETKAKLSTLWIFILLNILFRDMHEFFRPGFIDELINTNVSEVFLLLAGLIIELIIIMVVLSRFLPYRLNRWANMIVPFLAIIGVIFGGINDLDDILFATFGIGAALFIVWFAWNWTETKRQKTVW